MATTIKSDSGFDHITQAAPEYVEVVLWRRVILVLGALVAALLVAGWLLFHFLAGDPDQESLKVAPLQPDLMAPPGAVPAASDTQASAATSTSNVATDNAVSPASEPVSTQTTPTSSTTGTANTTPVTTTPAATKSQTTSQPPAASQTAPPATATTSAVVADRYKVKTEIFMPAIKRCALTQHMHGREPTTVLTNTGDLTGLDKFSLYQFVEVRGQAGNTLHYIWKRNGKVVAKVRVPVGSDKWRSYSSKNFNTRLLGNWEVDITDSKGRLMARSRFYLGT